MAVKLVKANFKPTEVPPVQTLIHVPLVGTFVISLSAVKVLSLDLSEDFTGVRLCCTSLTTKCE